MSVNLPQISSPTPVNQPNNTQTLRLKQYHSDLNSSASVYDRAIDNYARAGLNFKGSEAISNSPDVNSDEFKEQLKNNLFKTVKGLDTENFWVSRDLEILINGLDNKQSKELFNLTNDAIKKKIQVPYEKDAEYIEMPLPMADGRMHATKMFPHYMGGEMTMRTFLDNDIPDDKHMTCRDAYLDADMHNKKMHPGETWDFKPFCNPGMNTFNSDNVFERLTTRFNIANRIHYYWTNSPEDVKSFTKWYDDATFIHQRHVDRTLSPLHPGWIPR